MSQRRRLMAAFLVTRSDADLFLFLYSGNFLWIFEMGSSMANHFIEGKINAYAFECHL